MPRPALASLAVVAVLALVAPLVLPVGPGSTGTAVAQGLDQAREQVDGLQEELARATQRYEDTWARVEATRATLDQLERDAERLELEASTTEEQLVERARVVFKWGSTSRIELLLATGGADDAIERASLAALVQDRDTAGLQEAVATRTALAQATALVEQQRQELTAQTAELEQAQADLESQLDQARTRVASLEALAARQRTIDRGSQQGRYACPMAPQVTHFIDSWGFPRSGGRRHQGTDVMGPMGSPVYAFTDGVISRHSNSRLGGISLYLRGNDGNTYFYTHLQGYAPRGAVGSRVQAGEHIAYNGNTGNARGGPPHIHFERHPGGGRAVNPYPYLAAACF